jgi:hypothetical protein
MVVGTVVGLRFYRGDKEFKVFLGAFACATALYAVGFRLLPADVGFLPAAWVETSAPVDFVNGLVILMLVFHGFWSFSYFACVSPSMSALIALRLRGRAGMSRDEAMAVQGTAEPVNLIFQRRLPKLQRGGYVSEDANGYRLLDRGRRVAVFGSFLKRIINSQIGA